MTCRGLPFISRTRRIPRSPTDPIILFINSRKWSAQPASSSALQLQTPFPSSSHFYPSLLTQYFPFFFAESLLRIECVASLFVPMPFCFLCVMFHFSSQFFFLSLHPVVIVRFQSSCVFRHFFVFVLPSRRIRYLPWSIVGLQAFHLTLERRGRGRK